MLFNLFYPLLAAIILVTIARYLGYVKAEDLMIETVLQKIAHYWKS